MANSPHPIFFGNENSYPRKLYTVGKLMKTVGEKNMVKSLLPPGGRKCANDVLENTCIFHLLPNGVQFMGVTIFVSEKNRGRGKIGDFLALIEFVHQIVFLIIVYIYTHLLDFSSCNMSSYLTSALRASDNNCFHIQGSCATLKTLKFD